MATKPKKKTNITAKNTTAKKTTTKKITGEETVKKTTTKKITGEVKEQPNVKETKLDYKMIIIIILALLIMVIGIAKIGGVFENKDFSKSYLLSKKIINKEILKDDVRSVLLNNDVFIFITSLNDEEEYNLEKDLRKVIKDNNLKDNFYIYFKNDSDNLNELFGIDENNKTPTILYYKNGNLVDKVERNDEKMIEAADFAKLLDMYELSKEE